MSDAGFEALASTQTGQSGEFVFSVPGREGTYVIITQFEGVDYVSRPVRSGKNAAVADVTVYATTRDRPEIHFPYRIVLVERLGIGAIAVRELVGIVHESTRTYLGHEVTPNRRATLEVSLPRLAVDVTVARGFISSVVEKDRLIETAPLRPGSWEIAFDYQIRYWGTKATLRWILNSNTGSMDVFAPDQGERLVSDVLEAKPPGVVRGQRFLRVAGEQFPKGQVIEVTLTGLPANYAPVARWLAALLALILAGTIVMSLRASGRGEITPQEAG